MASNTEAGLYVVVAMAVHPVEIDTPNLDSSRVICHYQSLALYGHANTPTYRATPSPDARPRANPAI